MIATLTTIVEPDCTLVLRIAISARDGRKARNR